MRRRGGRAQILGLAAVLVIATALLSGCSAADEIGLTTDDRGRVSVQNCGTWITAVRVTDAETGAPIWGVRAVRDAAGAFDHSVGEVELGRAPVGWQETGSAPALGTSLRIVVESSLSDPRELTLNPPELGPGAVYYDGALRSGPFTDFCDPFYPYQGWVWLALGLVGVIGLGSFVVLLVVVTRASGSPDRPPPPPVV